MTERPTISRKFERAVADLELPPILKTIYEQSGRLALPARVAAQSLLTPRATAAKVLGADGKLVASITWGQLGDAVLSVACGLSRSGIGVGSRVGIALPKSIDHLIAAHAAWRVGAIVAPIDHRLPKAARSAMVEALQPDLVVDLGEDPNATAARSMAYLRSPREKLAWTLPSSWAIVPSGGTTGSPKLSELKGAVWGRLDQPSADQRRDYGLEVGQRQLVALPIFHGFGFTYLHAFGMALGHQVILLGDNGTAHLLAAIEEHRAQYLALVPTQMRRVYAHREFARRDLSSLQAVVHAGEACPPDVKRAWIDKVGAERVYEAYGASDISLRCSVRGDEWLRRPGTVGRPLGSEVRILDSAGRELPCGVVGLINCRPRELGAEHPRTLGGPTATREFRSTGDRGWVDDEGYLFVTGRADAAITLGGVAIDPEAVEEQIRRHPCVSDVVVVGMTDRQDYRRLHAFVVARPSITNADLLAWCRSELSSETCPKAITFVRRIPVTKAGKIDRRPTSYGANS